MEEPVLRQDVMPAGVPTWVVVALCVVALVGWLVLHRQSLRASRQWLRWSLVPAQMGLAMLVIWLAASSLERYVTLATDWSLWFIALLGAVTVEAVIGLYHRERVTTGPLAGWTLVGLRLGLVTALVLLLTKPVWSWSVDQTIERFVAVLIDDSMSMRLVDQNLDATETIRRARAVGHSVTGGDAWLQDAVDDLQQQKDQAATTMTSLETLRQSTAAQRSTAALAEPRKDVDQLRSAASTAGKRLTELTGESSQLPKSITDPLRGVVRSLQIAERRMQNAGQRLDGNPDRAFSQMAQAIDQLDQGQTELARCIAALVSLKPELDATRLANLSDDARRNLAGAINLTRSELAEVAFAGGRAGEGLAGKLRDDYVIRAYRFAAEPAKVELGDSVPASSDQTMPPDHGDPNGGADPSLASLALSPDQRLEQALEDPKPEMMRTDLAAALKQVETDLPPSRLAGVVVLSDGRHNGAGDVIAAARRLGRHAPINTVVVGSRLGPPDAAVVNVDAPQTIYLNDRITFDTTIKLEGLRGRKVKVRLLRADEQVAEQIVAAESDQQRVQVRMDDEPGVEGVHDYRVEIESLDDEIIKDNNYRLTSVAVTDDRTKVLLIDRRPRWEFRYLRNLLTSRDQSVRFQHLLLEPDEIDDQPPRANIPASVSREIDQMEATALPESEEEWLKFDVIILGDVAPLTLGAETMSTLRRFVVERGGSLIAIAGPDFMPSRYESTALMELLPVTLNETLAETKTAMMDRGLNVALTGVGREHMVMQLAGEPSQSAERWADVPRLYWRHPAAVARPGATVLAYAMPDVVPAALQPPDDGDVAAEARWVEAVSQYERDNALVIAQNVGLGRVLMLNHDRSWRLRFRRGDELHQRFWGQSLRWATSSKLRAGTQFVRLGTDRILYSPTEPVRVRARLADQTHRPVTDAKVAVQVWLEDQMVQRRDLRPTEAAAGYYEADLGVLTDPGRYRIELAGDGVTRLLTEGNYATVETHVIVSGDHAAPIELVEMSADRSLMNQVADISGGVAVEVDRAPDVLERLGPGMERYTQPRQTSLWDRWPVLGLMVMLLTGEWLLRKRVGLI